MTLLLKPSKGVITATEPSQRAYVNYKYGRLCFILVPLRGKINFGLRPQNKNLVPFRGRFRKIRRAPPSLLYESLSKKMLFSTVQNKMAPAFSIILRGLTLIFSKMLENLIAGALGEVK